MVKKTDQIQLVQQGDETPSAVLAMKFSSPDEVQSTEQALVDRSADLRALAKKAREIGRPREAISIEREAQHIGEALLPQIRTQTALPFNKDEQLNAAIRRTIGAPVFRKLRAAWPRLDGEHDDDWKARREGRIADLVDVVGPLVELVADAVQDVLEECAERGLAAGLAARNATAEALVLQALHVVIDETGPYVE